MKEDRRDELAARFMAALIAGTLASDVDPAVDPMASATKAYELADAFLAVRGEQVQPGGSDVGTAGA